MYESHTFCERLMNIHIHMETMHWMALAITFLKNNLRFGIENVIVDNDQLGSKLCSNERFEKKKI